MMTRTISVVALGMVLAAGTAAAAPEKPKSPAKKAPTVKTESAKDAEPSGKVMETMDAAGYTYVRLEKDGRQTWVAVPQMKVAKGATMSFQPGQTMTNFESKSLNRTFDAIVFSAGPAGPAGTSLPPGHPGVPAGAAGPSGSKAQVARKDKTIKVEKASGENAYTIAQVFAKRSSLNGKQITVRGQVVKISKGIMGRNWVHLQDGTGDQAKGTHDLVVTCMEVPEVGDVVTATGPLRKDRDFGAGYLFKAILEDGKLVE
jgi:hypothetical protein